MGKPRNAKNIDIEEIRTPASYDSRKPLFTQKKKRILESTALDQLGHNAYFVIEKILRVTR